MSPFVPRLPAARLARTAAKAAGNARLLPQPIARWRLGVRRAVLIQAPAKLGVLRPQRRVLASQIRDLAPKPLDQIANLGRENHPNLDSHFPPRSSRKIRLDLTIPTPMWQFGLTLLGSYKGARKRA